jgi:carboxyl-terminal processing protease
MSSSPRVWRLPVVVLFGAICLAGVFSSQTARADELKDFKDKALAAEKRHDWLDACRWYDKSLRKDRTQADVRDAYQRCLRRLYVVRRCEDRVYKDAVAKLNESQARDVYQQVLDVVGPAYVDPSRSDANSLFHQGLQELRYDFDEAVFLQQYVPGAKSAAVTAFKKVLDDWQSHKVNNSKDAREEVVALIQAARRCELDVKPALATVIGLEFASGACNGLDEYTLFLSPGYANDVQASIQSHYVSIGVELGMNGDNKVEIVRVFANSPAAEKSLKEHDIIVKIDGERVISADQAADKLRGESLSMVDIEYSRPGEVPSVAHVQRRPYNLPSVPEAQVFADAMSPMRIGYIRINHFQDSTAQDVQERLAYLQTIGVNALILDLRGNPGGVFQAGVQVADLFLNEGTVVSSESPLGEFNRPFGVGSKNPVQLPVVVLVDRDTASAAEVVAGALKDQRHANTLIVGQTTFGKGSIQGVIPLDKAPLDKTPGGVRITVAKLYSPSKHQAYTDRGVTPDVSVDQEGDALTRAGIDAAVQLLKSGGMKMN